ncbi:hypothetical protein [Paenibacillus apiarius]|uniref:hypothetical protein n=1 Tax=Paenibacillus apiarius TaxID=46240 RepID=UPI003B3A5028
MENELILEFQARAAELYERVLGGTEGRYYYFTWDADLGEASEIKISADPYIYSDRKTIYGATQKIQMSKKAYVEEMTAMLLEDEGHA